MTPVDLALLIALSVTGGALLALGGFHDWRLRVLERHLWGDPDRGRRPARSARTAPTAEPPPHPSEPIRERIRLAELRLQQARESLEALRRETVAR